MNPGVAESLPNENANGTGGLFSISPPFADGRCVRLRRRHSLSMRRNRGYVIRLIPKETSLKTRPLEAEGLFYAPRGSAASHWPPGRASLMGLL